MITFITAVVGNINLCPENELEEIRQNIATILSTPKYSVPMYRDFGVEGGIVDKPTVIAKSKLISEIISSIRQYEPRVEVESVSFTATADGVLKPRVKVIINET